MPLQISYTSVYADALIWVSTCAKAYSYNFMCAHVYDFYTYACPSAAVDACLCVNAHVMCIFHVHSQTYCLYLANTDSYANVVYALACVCHYPDAYSKRMLMHMPMLTSIPMPVHTFIHTPMLRLMPVSVPMRMPRCLYLCSCRTCTQTLDHSVSFQVFFVDYGNSEWTRENNIKRMLPHFLHLPFQALECFLGNVEPTRDSHVNGRKLEWSEDAM